jgi:sugar lactone lactonase YvrE
VDSGGRIIVADTYNDRIRAIDPTGSVTTVAGSGQPGILDGAAAEAQFDTPCGVATDASGNIYVADTGNGVVRVISPAGRVTTVAGSEGLVRPMGVAVAGSGFLYVADEPGRVIEIGPDGGMRTLAGSRPGFADGEGPGALFRGLSGVAIAAPGRLVVTDSRNALVRLVTARTRLELRAPAPPFRAPRFDADAFGAQPLLWPLAPMEGPFEITGTLGEARGAGGADRFHAGVDVHAPEGVVVRAVRGGTVTSPVAAAEFDSLNESVRIGPLTYVHLRVGRTRGGQVLDTERFVPTYDETGRLVRVRVRRGAHFATGAAVGTTNAFNHVHLNVGWPGEEYNPLQFRLVQFVDTTPPTIPRGGIRVLDEYGVPLKERRKGRLLVTGRVQIAVDAWD